MEQEDGFTPPRNLEGSTQQTTVMLDWLIDALYGALERAICSCPVYWHDEDAKKRVTALIAEQSNAIKQTLAGISRTRRPSLVRSSPLGSPVNQLSPSLPRNAASEGNEVTSDASSAGTESPDRSSPSGHNNTGTSSDLDSRNTALTPVTAIRKFRQLTEMAIGLNAWDLL